MIRLCQAILDHFVEFNSSNPLPTCRAMTTPSFQAFKKLAFAAIILLSVLAQGYFIYAVQHGGAGAFNNVWSGFDSAQSSYSTFVFATIQWWWSLPLACLALAVTSVLRRRPRLAALTLIFSCAGTIALYWSAYAPSLFIQI